MNGNAMIRRVSTANDVACESCDGDGRHICRRCNGLGGTLCVCETCRGSCHETCEACGGSGSIEGPLRDLRRALEDMRKTIDGVNWFAKPPIGALTPSCAVMMFDLRVREALECLEKVEACR